MAGTFEDRSPLVSIVVPTFNRPQFLSRALESIGRQTFRDFEVIVVNDAGEDVGGVIRTFENAFPIRYLSHPVNRGLAAARNTALRAARGVYAAYLDDDDLYYPHHLQTLVGALERGTHAVAYTDAYRVSTTATGPVRELVSWEFDAEALAVRNYIPVLCLMHRRSLLEEVGFFDESLNRHEDWDLWIRMAQRYPFIHVPEATCEISWRSDGSTMTSGARVHFQLTRAKIFRKHLSVYRNNSNVLAGQLADCVNDVEALSAQVIYLSDRLARFERHPVYRVRAALRRIVRKLHGLAAR